MKSFDKIIEKSFSSFAKLNGFTQKKGLFWCCINNGLIKAIGFNKTSAKYEALYFVQPLFDSKDYWILEYGDTLVRRYSQNSKELLLYRNLEESLFNGNLENVNKCFEKDIIAKLNSIYDANSLYNVINGDLFFCSTKNRLRLSAYSLLYSKKYEDAELLFKLYIEAEKKDGCYFEERISESQKLLETMKNNPEMAYSMLAANVVESSRMLKI